jgi:hypothetical protein
MLTVDAANGPRYRVGDSPNPAGTQVVQRMQVTLVVEAVVESLPTRRKTGLAGRGPRAVAAEGET